MSDQTNNHAQEHHVEGVGLYVIIWAALIGLTVLTTAVAFVNLGFFSVVVALGIATCKMLLVVLFFMHARHSSQLTKLSLFAAVLWLLILLGMISIDFISRGWMGVPGR
jgi:cytochrome c oxidase subunit 4